MLAAGKAISERGVACSLTAIVCQYEIDVSYHRTLPFVQNVFLSIKCFIIHVPRGYDDVHFGIKLEKWRSR